MVADRVSLIIAASFAPASRYASLVLESGFPNPASLEAYFTEIPILLESSDLRENSEDTPHGELLDIKVRLRIGRESSIYRDLVHQRVLLAISTANGEQHLLGTNAYPLRCEYDRDSGASITSPSDTTLTFSAKIPM
jgi:hypothetical protein